MAQKKRMSAAPVRTMLAATGWNTDTLWQLAGAEPADRRGIRKLAKGRDARLTAGAVDKLSRAADILSRLADAFGDDIAAVGEVLYRRQGDPSVYDDLMCGSWQSAAEKIDAILDPRENTATEKASGRRGKRRPYFGGQRQLYVRRAGDKFEVVVKDGTVVVERYLVSDQADEVQPGNIYLGRIVKVRDNDIFCDLGIGEEVFCARDDLGEPDDGVPLTERYRRGGTLIMGLRSLGVRRRNKGPRGTCRYELAGQYVSIQAAPGQAEAQVVVTLTTKGSYQEARRWAAQYESKLPPALRVVVHGEADADAWSQELAGLLSVMMQIEQSAKQRGPTPRLLWEEASPLRQVLRDRSTFGAVVWVEGDDEDYRRVAEAAGGLVEVRRWNPADGFMYDAAHIRPAVESSLSRVVELNTGGNLVIDPTEAGTCIDVNAGASDRHQTNLAAAQEIARQIRLRNIGGLIFVDFAGGGLRADQSTFEEVIDRLYQALIGDPGRTRLYYNPETHTAEISRMRTELGFDETAVQKECGTLNAA